MVAAIMVAAIMVAAIMVAAIMVAAIMVAESISVRNIFFTKASVGNATWLDLGMYIN